jgi:hypothetical protein
MARAFLSTTTLVLSVALLTLSPLNPAHAGEGSPPAAPTASVPALPSALPSAPWLGVQMDAGGDIGVAVEHVVRGSPADTARAQVG